MKSYEFIGKTVEKAIENGLKELNKNREDVDISIISQGGLFSKAKVEISYDEEINEETLKEIIDEEINEEETEKQNEENVYTDDECSDCGCMQGDECTCEECECGCDCECECECEEENCECENVEMNKNDSTKEEKPAKKVMTSEEVFDKIQEIFSNIFKTLNINGRVMTMENDDTYEVKISGDENVSALIGYRGEALNAYQILINSFTELKYRTKKILLDVEGYRSKREESLTNLAIRIAKKVLKTNKRYKFEPMSSYERHVIHEALSNFNGVTTHSEGVEPRRCLIVDIEKVEK